jgi:hypothetical protein
VPTSFCLDKYCTVDFWQFLVIVKTISALSEVLWLEKRDDKGNHFFDESFFKKCVITETTQPRIQAAEMEFLRQVVGQKCRLFVNSSQSGRIRGMKMNRPSLTHHSFTFLISLISASFCLSITCKRSFSPRNENNL